VAIKPGIDQVEHHYRNRHKTAGRQLQEVIAFVASFSPSGSQPSAPYPNKFYVEFICFYAKQPGVELIFTGE
jgi:hypothetical protein